MINDMKIKDFYNTLHKTAKSAGMKIISDDYCCQLLAWLLVIGGSYEATVYNVFLNSDIAEAQDRLNLYGGELFEKQHIELLPTLKSYKKELDLYIDGKIEKPEWVINIENKYKLHPYKLEL